jgi:topoisomerase IV subunit A
VEEKRVFNILYRDGVQNLCYVKRFKTPKFILEKEYHLFPPHKRSELLFLKTGEGIHLRIHYAPNKKAKRNYEDFAFDDFLVKGTSAIGKRLSTRVVRRIVEQEPPREAAPGTGQEPVPQPVLFPDAEPVKPAGQEVLPPEPAAPSATSDTDDDK